MLEDRGVAHRLLRWGDHRAGAPPDRAHREDVDDWIWAIVGDLPSAYIAPAAPKPSEALRDYIFQVRRRVAAAKDEKPVDDWIPVNVPATLEWAEKLERRLDFLETEILPEVPQLLGDPLSGQWRRI